MNLKNYNAAYYSQWPSKIRIIAFGLLFGINSCSSPLYVPGKDNIPATANIDNLKKGRELYVSKCASCHTIFLPEKYNRIEWSKTVNRMQPKAKITDEEKNLILDYLSKGK